MIDKIDRVKSSDPTNISSSVKRTSAPSSSSANFSSSVAAKVSASGNGIDSAFSVSSLLGAGSVSFMLGVQELGDALSRAAQGKRRAEDTLKKLDRIKLGLVSGTLNKLELEALSRVVSQEKEVIDDPLLSEILDEIDLRAKVELAKYLG